MGKLVFQYLEGDNIYTCKTCNIHLSSFVELISKAFRGRGGKAFLFNIVINITTGPCEDRMLLSGMHTVCDIFCKGCLNLVGWKYEHAHEESQKYKEGKFILEREQIKKEYWTI